MITTCIRRRQAYTNGVELAILVGLPAAGKSTFCRERLRGHVVVSKDLLPNVRDRGARQQRLVAAALSEGRDVVVDNTNVSRASRAPLIALGRRFGARVVAYFFPIDAQTALARNERREGRARVPAVAIFAARKRLEPPAVEEGFDAVHRVDVASAT
jgi:predicted kinase